MNPTLHDFRIGKTCWGHALHASTMREVPPEGWLQKWKDWRHEAYRASVMVHCTPYPKVGDYIAWSRANGGEMVAPIVAVEYCTNPADMFTLTIRVTPDCRSGA